MIPPVNSALDLYFNPKILPILTPITDNVKVIIPINETAGNTSIFKNAKETPTAKASMLVAIAKTDIVRKFSDVSAFSHASWAVVT